VAVVVALTDVLWARATPRPVSPALTVCVDADEEAAPEGLGVVPEGAFEEEPPPAPGIWSTWPARMRLGSESLLAEASFAVVVPYRAAIALNVSPLATW